MKLFEFASLVCAPHLVPPPNTIATSPYIFGLDIVTHFLSEMALT